MSVVGSILNAAEKSTQLCHEDSGLSISLDDALWKRMTLHSSLLATSGAGTHDHHFLPLPAQPLQP